MRKYLLLPLMLFAAAFAVTGCSDYVRETPEYTTPQSRDTGFKASVYSDGKGEVDADSIEVGEQVESGIKSVQSTAGEMKSIVDEQADQLEEEANQKTEWPSDQF